jgi:hypothetical protein
LTAMNSQTLPTATWWIKICSSTHLWGWPLMMSIHIMPTIDQPCQFPQFSRRWDKLTWWHQCQQQQESAWKGIVSWVVSVNYP